MADDSEFASGDRLTTRAGELLEEIFHQRRSASQVLDRHFRQHRCGSTERNRLTEIVFTVLRQRRRLEHRLAVDEPGRAVGGLALAAAVPLLAVGADDVPLPPLTSAREYSLPDWLWDRLCDQWGEAETRRLAAALNQPASVDLRVNRRKSDRQRALAALGAAGIDVAATPYAPDGIRLHRRQPLGGLEIHRQGHLEVQDEGSQLIGHLLDPHPGTTVVDLCAGGGGKTLHMAALMAGRGRVIAVDREQRRLNRGRNRLKRAGIAGMVRLVPVRHERDRRLKPWTGKADAVLVDAPCDGTGTLRRHPEIRWHLQPHQVLEYQHRQLALLAAGAALTRPGGILVYATCSLLAAANETVVESFLQENKTFKMVPAGPFLASRGIGGLPGSKPFLNLLPHLTGTDGFFAARLQRRH